MILYHAADLLWASKLKSTAEIHGLAARPVRSVQMLEARLADSPVRALMVDLDQPEVALAILERLAQLPAAGVVRTLAYGPHVSVEHFQEAKRLGAQVLMARGTLVRRLPDVLTGLAGPDSSDAWSPGQD